MAQGQYLVFENGVRKLRTAIDTSAGSADANKIAKLGPGGKFDITLMPTGIGDDSISFTTSEDLAAGDFVNIYDNSGTPTARKADASTNKPAHGFVTAGSTSGNSATVFFEGTNDQLTGLTAGEELFLSTSSPGGHQSSAPTGSGEIIQYLGVAASSTSMNFEGAIPVVEIE